MTSRILVVDAVPTNRIILRVKLSAAYYDVVQASSGTAALDMMRTSAPDLVITASELPDMSGRDLCAAIHEKSARRRGPATPVIITHNANDKAGRMASLAAGADDLLERPIDDLVMLARLRSLLRARDAEAELRLRDDTRRALGLEEQAAEFATPGRIRIISTGHQPEMSTLVHQLQQRTEHRIELVGTDDPLKNAVRAPDVVVVAEAQGTEGTGLSLLPQLRANRSTRHCALIYVAQSNQRREAATALDLGANDLMVSGFDVEELSIRLKKQITRKRTNDRLRANMRDGLRAAVIDPLTGLYNRRYALPYATRLAERTAVSRKPYAILLADLDHFKHINDDYGHSAGDVVLATVARRIKDNLRAGDLTARWGGEEFLVAMPDTNRQIAQRTAERVTALISDTPITLPDGQNIPVTLSVGVAIGYGADDLPEELIARADNALYAAKHQGRNTVVMADTVTALSPREAPKAEYGPIDDLPQTGTYGPALPTLRQS
ncbi:diguanylate cyclase [Sagittula sp. NFXS13]|uniref:diguanylate cyclase n=1 Tax=Sagittula sp. NFXS13 TaxID=2819095 RepID=UPI0032DF6D61